MKVVLFACVHNAGRSQMAAAFLNRLVGSGDVRASSAGTAPAERVHPEVASVMAEAGIDISGAQPQKLTPELSRKAAMLVTLGCGEDCPLVPGVPREDWALEDPKGKPLARVREIREELRLRVADLLSRRPWSNPAERI